MKIIFEYQKKGNLIFGTVREKGLFHGLMGRGVGGGGGGREWGKTLMYEGYVIGNNISETNYVGEFLWSEGVSFF